MTTCAASRPYRVIVTGSRDWCQPDDITIILDNIRRDHPRLIVVHGGCLGADVMAESWARHHHVTTEVHPARWELHGKAAGPRRNLAMVRLGADLCVAFIRNYSRGASHCAAAAITEDILTVVIRDDDDPGRWHLEIDALKVAS